MEYGCNKLKQSVLVTLAQGCITRKKFRERKIPDPLHQSQSPHKGYLHKFSFTRKTEGMSDRLRIHCHTESGNVVSSLASELCINTRKLLVPGHKPSGVRGATVVFAFRDSSCPADRLPSLLI